MPVVRVALCAVLFSCCGGSSQVYLDSNDQPLQEPGTRIEPDPQGPPAHRRRRPGPGMFTVHLESACDDAVHVFIGESRDDENGEDVTLESGAPVSKNGFLPSAVFLVDASGATVSQVEASAGSQTIRVLASCTVIEAGE